MIMHILVLDQRSLTANLGTDGIMWETGGREERNLLATGDGVHDIDGGNSRLDHLLRVVTLERINWLALNIEEVLGEHGWTVVDRLTLTVELATKHLCGDGHLEDVASELAMRVRVVNVSRAFEDLNDSFSSSDLKDLTLSILAVAKLHVDDFGVPGELDVVEDDEGALDVQNGTVVDAGRNVVVTYGSAGVHDVVSHFTRIVCCFSCKLLKFAFSKS